MIKISAFSQVLLLLLESFFFTRTFPCGENPPFILLTCDIGTVYFWLYPSYARLKFIHPITQYIRLRRDAFSHPTPKALLKRETSNQHQRKKILELFLLGVLPTSCDHLALETHSNPLYSIFNPNREFELKKSSAIKKYVCTFSFGLSVFFSPLRGCWKGVLEAFDLTRVFGTIRRWRWERGKEIRSFSSFLPVQWICNVWIFADFARNLSGREVDNFI